MIDFMDLYRLTGRCPTLAEKLAHAPNLTDLDAMVGACAARDHVLTNDEAQAAARRRVELSRGGR